MSRRNDNHRIQSRRKFLRTSGAAVAGMGGLLAIGSAPVRAALPYGVSVSNGGDGEYIYYEIEVSGDIDAQNNIESNDSDNGASVSGVVDSSDNSDDWQYSGYVTKAYVSGVGDLTFYATGDQTTPEYYVDLYTNYGDSNNRASYTWKQDGYIYERNNSTESDDFINSDNDEVQGYVDTYSDQFRARGHPRYLYLDSNGTNIYWDAYNF